MELSHLTEDFSLENAENYRGLYFPMASEKGLKSAITPDLCGDAKLDQNHFLLEPVSIGNLSESTMSRNFWLRIYQEEDMHIRSITGRSALQMAEAGLRKCRADHLSGRKLEAGYMWQRVTGEILINDRDDEKHGRAKEGQKGIRLLTRITSFVPKDHNTEIHRIEVQNQGKQAVELAFTTAIPIYGRSADNQRDHRHVTSLLNRSYLRKNGIFMRPSMSFDERGHGQNQTTYFVSGYEEGSSPSAFYPDLSTFSGEGGNLLWPRMLIEDKPGYENPFLERQMSEKVDETLKKASQEMSALEINPGREVLGGLHFRRRTLEVGESVSWIILTGIGEDMEEAIALSELVRTEQDAEALRLETVDYWRDKVRIRFQTGNPTFDHFMRWVAFQPELRRIYGCSFLPHHDYGRGGRGWRDLWQDCLSLLLMNPEEVRPLLLANAEGFRMNGTNATIIGDKPGQFKADRNGIPRIWMDHGFWPYLTSELYYDLTGDQEFWAEERSYFSDSEPDGKQRDQEGKVHMASMLEHLLLPQLRAFYDVGEHGCMRLHGADWNDAMDMAADQGESVAFTHAYAMNLDSLAERLEDFLKGQEILLTEEVGSLLEEEARSPAERRQVLLAYEKRLQGGLSGRKVSVSSERLAKNLRRKADFLKDLLRREEYKQGFFNSYYDNHGKAIQELILTGQVFAIMGHVADESMTDEIASTVRERLFLAEVGGVRLNEDLRGVRIDVGRMTGFAYGNKENGAVFSHMAVMYAFALLSRGRLEKGWEVLKSLFESSMNTEKSRMLPGIPEYFDPQGRGLYSYLTGAASWYLYTMVHEVFGIRFRGGEYEIRPQLPEELFEDVEHISIWIPLKGEEKEVSLYRDGRVEIKQAN